ncbi:MAG: hypothetical protein EPO11_03370 [Gammaproteobacteria bacterium]|nr:MAG: hypothetical protein EPO11_03370 [Gammaproteobacteria bacterium]
MKKRIRHYLAVALTLSGVAINAYAVAPGFYIGIMGGPATNNAKETTVQAPDDQDNSANTNTSPVTFKPKSNQFATRVFMGYKVNPYAAIEMGGSYYSTIRYETKTGDNTCGTPSISLGSVDLVGKGSIPLGWFEVYGKAGVAGVYQHTSGALDSSSDITITYSDGTTATVNSCSKSSSTTQARGTASLGISYDLSQNVVADISYNRLFTSGDTGAITTYALGISYHFVDKYCGQFLCDD